MKSLTSRFCIVVSASILATALWLLATSRLEYCGPAATSSPVGVAAASPDNAPTLAPPREVVIVRVETDKADVQVGWADNWQLYRQLTNQ